MSRVVQEKFQVTAPQQRNDDADSGWVRPRDMRTKKGTPGREGHLGGDPESRTMDNAVMYNTLPPGMDIADQELGDIRQQRLVTGGTDDVTDNPKGGDFKKGYVAVELTGTDDMYSREHNDAFYDEVHVDGKTGYVERNNYLDRL